jgi:hypothetical protein
VEINTLLNNKWVKGEITRKIRKYLILLKIKAYILKLTGCSENSIGRKIYNCKCLQ